LSAAARRSRSRSPHHGCQEHHSLHKRQLQ
jgi:hypothetical protein